MDESIIRGLVVGFLFLVIGWASTVLWKAFRSPTEGMRRLRLAIGIGFGLFVLYGVGMSYGATGVLATIALLGIVFWIFRGFKCKA